MPRRQGDVSLDSPARPATPTSAVKTLLNGTLVSNIVIDTSQVATDTIDYVRHRPKRPHLNLNKNCPHRACHVICRRRHDNSRNLDRSVEPRGSAGNRAHTSRLVTRNPEKCHYSSTYSE